MTPETLMGAAVGAAVGGLVSWVVRKGTAAADDVPLVRQQLTDALQQLREAVADIRAVVATVTGHTYELQHLRELVARLRQEHDTLHAQVHAMHSNTLTVALQRAAKGEE